MTLEIAPGALHDRLARADGELALIDIRDEGTFSEGHLLFATNVPAAAPDALFQRLVPRAATPVVLCDDGDGAAAGYGERLARLGYDDVSVLAGGIGGWRAAGFEVFTGVNVPSKAFGELVEARRETPRLGAQELAALKAKDADLVVLDSRPFAEYHRMNIPGGISVPGAELVRHVRDLAPNPETLVVVNCAGRTRSIIGAQSLINAGVANPVMALENGTMGWTLAGLELEKKQDRRPAPPSDSACDWARDHAQALAARLEVPRIDRATFAGWQAEQDRRTLYLCDVRSPEDYAAGHLPGARSTPGGQLVQATDTYIGTLGARIVLVDDDGIRAAITASWLVQMGRRDVTLLEPGLGADDALEAGAEPAIDTGAGKRWKAPYTTDAKERRAAMQAYLDWETALPEQIARDGTTRFNVWAG